MDAAGMRISYERDRLDESDAPVEPLPLFERWFAQAVAANLPEPNAMTLATVGADGHPSTRIVLVKGIGPDGLVFFTNYDSRKGRELAVHPHAALQFHWVELQRVVRIEGTVARTTDAESDAYFGSRPLGSRVGAWASPQSRVIADRAELERLDADAAARLGPDPARPPHWGGFRLTPAVWEFWQGRPSRLHDRLRYRWVEGRWVRERLAP